MKVHFGYKPTIFYPKPGTNPLYQRLVTQASNLDIPLLTDQSLFTQAINEHSIILDAIFGSFEKSKYKLINEI